MEQIKCNIGSQAIQLCLFYAKIDYELARVNDDVKIYYYTVLCKI